MKLGVYTDHAARRRARLATEVGGKFESEPWITPILYELVSDAIRHTDYDAEALDSVIVAAVRHAVSLRGSRGAYSRGAA